MVPGDVVSIAGAEIEILLVEAHGPGPDCHDCPNSALLLVRSNGDTQELKYTFSGNMLRELLIKAKRKEAFGYVLIAERIDDDSFTLRVEPDSS